MPKLLLDVSQLIFNFILVVFILEKFNLKLLVFHYIAQHLRVD
jgi:hypothetical protein